MSLNCIYHPIHPMRVVEDEEKDKLISSEGWFDHPSLASLAKEDYEKKRLQRSKRKDED